MFYVGKGSGRRFSDKGLRTSAWLERALNGFTSEIVFDNLEEKEALWKESELIETPLGGWKLVNVHKPLINNVSLSNALLWFKYSSESPSGLVWSDEHPPLPPFCKSKVVPGEPLGYFTKTGYWKINVPCSGIVSAHRVVYALNNPDTNIEGLVINHIDTNPSNNRIENLELVTQKINNRRRGNNLGNVRTDNKSGVNGVYKSIDKRQGSFRYRAMWMTLEGEKKTKSFSCNLLGETEAFRLACEYRAQKIRELNEQGAGYTERHGT